MCPSDGPSIRSTVRPTDSPPVLLRCKISTVLTATIFTIFTVSIKVAACGRHHKRGGAAFGRATSFVVSFVLALNSVNIVAVTTIIVVHVGVIGYHVPRQSCFMFPRRSCNARLRARGVWGGVQPPQGSRGVWGAARPPMVCGDSSVHRFIGSSEIVTAKWILR